MSKWLVLVAVLGGCKFPYPADVPDDAGPAIDATAQCTPSTTSCSAGTLTVCDALGHPSSQTACTFGCAPGGAARCGDLAPSNNLGMYLDQARTAAPIVWNGDAVIDTDTGGVTVSGTTENVQTAVVPSAPVEILVVIAKAVDVRNVTAHGRRALAIVADSDITLRGTFSVSAVGGVPGPGGSSVLDPACTASVASLGTNGSGGAGGGGFGTAGGRGGNGGDSQGGQGGAVAGNAQLVPLRGGCPGAYAYGVQSGGYGGRPGGALQLSTRGAIVLEAAAKLAASGGGARGPVECAPICPTCTVEQGQVPGCYPGSGGGSGGAILLEARALNVAASAAITANGGAGHCSSVGTSADGTMTESAAMGSICPAGIGSGGNGGAGEGGGFAGAADFPYGGGGGGGTGRIRVNLAPGTGFDPGPPVVSPLPSIATTSVR